MVFSLSSPAGLSLDGTEVGMAFMRNGESVEFNEKYLEPVFKAQRVPLYYADHPMFAAAARSDICEKAAVGVGS